MTKPHIEKSYISKILFYLTALALPLILMTLVIIAAPDSIISPVAAEPSKFLFFALYFLPGLILARSVTKNWRKTVGIGVAYMFMSPAYYIYAADYACRLTDSCLTV